MLIRFFKSCFKTFLGYLLHLANRSVSIISREGFYNLKVKLLKRYGTFDSIEMQHVKKECYSCKNGVFISKWKEPDTCWACCGTGIYTEFYTRLEKYKLGNYYFHTPTAKALKYDKVEGKFYFSSCVHQYKPIEADKAVLIEGLIEHTKPNYNLAREATLWLYLFFDFKLFKKEIRSVQCLRGVRTPLVLLGNIIFRVRNFEFKKLIPKLNLRKQKVKLNKASVFDSDDLPF
jgi:ribosomal protein S27AE